MNTRNLNQQKNNVKDPNKIKGPDIEEDEETNDDINHKTNNGAQGEQDDDIEDEVGYSEIQTNYGDNKAAHQFSITNPLINQNKEYREQFQSIIIAETSSKQKVSFGKPEKPIDPRINNPQKEGKQLFNSKILLKVQEVKEIIEEIDEDKLCLLLQRNPGLMTIEAGELASSFMLDELELSD